MSSARMPDSTSAYVLGSSASAQSDDALNTRLLELDPQFTRQTKNQISQLVAEIGELARQPLTTEHFLAGMLPRVLAAMGAIGAAVWQQESSGDWRLIASQALPPELLSDSITEDISSNDGRKLGDQLNGSDSFDARIESLNQTIDSELKDSGRGSMEQLVEQKRPSQEHEQLMNQVASEGQPVSVPPAGVTMANNKPANPIEQLLIFSPVPFDSNNQKFWLEIVQRPSGGPATQRGYLRFVAQMADLTADFLKTQRLHELESEKRYLDSTEKLLDRISVQENRAVSLSDLVDELRNLSNADQVFVVYKLGRRDWSILAASGLDAIDARGGGSQSVRHFATFACRAAASQERTWNATTDCGLDPRCDDFFALFQSTYVSWNPVIGCDPQRSTTGVAVIQIWSCSSPPLIHARRVAALTSLSLRAIQPSWLHAVLRNNLQAKRSWKDLVFPNRWPRAIQVAAICSVVGIVGAIPVPVKIKASAVLHPTKYRIEAPADGTVEYAANFGEQVLENEVVATISNLDVDLKLRSLENELIGLKKVQSNIVMNTNLGATKDDRSALSLSRSTIDDQIFSKQEEIAELTKFINQDLNISTSIPGTIGTWNAKTSLENYMVKKGDTIATVNQLKADWVFDVEIAERDVALVQTLSESDSLNVAGAYLLNNPNTTLKIELKSLGNQMVASSVDERALVLRARYTIAAKDLLSASDGAAARIEIKCGKAPLAWALFRDAILSGWSSVRLWI